IPLSEPETRPTPRVGITNLPWICIGHGRSVSPYGKVRPRLRLHARRCLSGTLHAIYPQPYRSPHRPTSTPNQNAVCAAWTNILSRRHSRSRFSLFGVGLTTGSTGAREANFLWFHQCRSRPSLMRGVQRIGWTGRGTIFHVHAPGARK